MTEEVTPKKKPRRKRRSKAEIAAEKEAKAVLAAEEEAKKAEGLEKVRARDDQGHFIADDPSTPENEAWEWQKTDELVLEMFEESVASDAPVVEEPAPVVEEPVVSEPEPEPEPEPVPEPLPVVIETKEEKPKLSQGKERRRFGYAGVRQRMEAARKRNSLD